MVIKKKKFQQPERLRQHFLSYVKKTTEGGPNPPPAGIVLNMIIQDALFMLRVAKSTWNLRRVDVIWFTGK